MKLTKLLHISTFMMTLLDQISTAKAAFNRRNKKDTTLINSRRHLLFKVRETCTLFKEAFPNIKIAIGLLQH